MSKSTLIAWAIFAVGLVLVAGYYFRTVPGSEPAVVTDRPGEAGGTQIVLTIAGEAEGDVVIELFDKLAPKHAERLVTLTREGAYDGVVFHRVIDGFMAQTGDVEHGKAGGDIRLAGTGGSSYPDLPAEFSEENFVAGTVGMARSSDPNSANSQFYIMFEPAPHLDGVYTIVGRVIEGLDVVMAIKRGEGPNGAVIGEPDRIVSARVVE